jgi:hypothetical protein
MEGCMALVALAPTFFGVFIDKSIQEVCERIKSQACQVWTGRQQLMREQLTC